MKRLAAATLLTGLGIAALAAQAGAPAMMSADWAKDACAAWNQDAVLTDGLVQSGWIENDDRRGYKVMHVFRTECKGSRPVELRIAKKDGKALCVYGGAIENAKLNDAADYLMHAETPRWIEMGRGEYGPMRAMMFGRLQFEGPKMEAMANMGPFENFLLLVGKVQADSGSCPK
jgi:putative sterol carrier protein